MLQDALARPAYVMTVLYLLSVAAYGAGFYVGRMLQRLEDTDRGHDDA